MAGCETGKKFIYEEDKPTFTTVYKLVVIDQDDKRKIEELTVQVLAPGWHKIAFPRRGYPTVFCNMNDAKLYGIFKKDGKASLYSSIYPLSIGNLKMRMSRREWRPALPFAITTNCGLWVAALPIRIRPPEKFSATKTVHGATRATKCRTDSRLAWVIPALFSRIKSGYWEGMKTVLMR